MQIDKSRKQSTVTGAEESAQPEKSVRSKSRTPKGIAETETKFESPKTYSLFQNHNSRLEECAKSHDEGATTGQVVKAQSVDGSVRTVGSNNPPPNTTTITDGSSNTISFEEEQQTTEKTDQPADGSVRTVGGIGVQLGDGSVRTVGNNNPPPNTTTITDGSSNTISFEEEQQTTEKKDQPADGSVRTVGGVGVQLGDGSVRTVGSSDTPQNTTTITDGSSNTISFGEEEQPAEETEQSAEATTDQDSNLLFQDVTSGTPITSRSDISGGTTEQTAKAEAADGSVTTVESSDATAETTTTADDVSSDTIS